jgi:hypothetical protein
MKRNAATWLMLLYNLPARPSTQRVYVWRKLKSCGVLYWQHSVCILPARPGFRERFEQLKRDIEERRGEAIISTIQFPEHKEQESLVTRFRQQADEEYQEFLGQCRDFHEELAKERKACHFTFAELEENEVELAKLRSWLPKIHQRDFFRGTLESTAKKALAACEKDFARFSATIAEVNERNLQTPELARKRPKSKS